MAQFCPKTPLLLHWYAFAHHHKGSLCFFFLLTMLFLLWHIQTLTFSNSILAFFPEEEATTKLVQNLSLVPHAQYCVVVLEAKSHVVDLQTKAEQFRSEIAPSLFHSTAFSPTPHLFSILLPVQFTAEVEAAILPKFASIDQEIQTDFALLNMATAPLLPWLREDPLHWIKHFEQKLPQSQNLQISKDARHCLLTLKPLGSMNDTAFANKAYAELERVAALFSDHFVVHVAGGIRHTASNAKSIETDVQHIFLFSFLGLAIIYLLLVRSLGAFWLILTPALAMSFSMGVVSFFFPTLYGLALGFGSAVLGLSEDYAVHMHFALRTAKYDHVLKALPMPLLQGLLLNSSGFVVILLCSSLPALKQLATLSLFSLIFGFLLALF
ncbi:MAG: hypothetical protein IK079_06625, partial [Desulfovibrio sp.]|nr:hypothetical protein [Desulfovibrio sp.]